MQQFSIRVPQRVCRCAAGVLGEGRKEAREKKRNENIIKISLIFKNNTMIRILAIELLNTLLLLAF
jgi:hypothetical protein